MYECKTKKMKKKNVNQVSAPRTANSSQPTLTAAAVQCLLLHLNAQNQAESKFSQHALVTGEAAEFAVHQVVNTQRINFTEKKPETPAEPPELKVVPQRDV